MKTFLNRMCLVIAMAVVSHTALANNPVPEYAALESFGCNFQPGKDRNDMVKWAGKWNAAAKDIFSAPYMAMLLDPFLMNPADQQHDIYWVGYSPNFAAQGAVQDDWNAKAGKLADELLKIADCDTHAIWAMTTTRGSGNTTPPATGVLTFQACSMVGDTTMMDLAAADAQMNAFMDNIEQPSPRWRWWPVSGLNSENQMDFFSVSGNLSLQQKGQTMDNFVQNGGLQAQTEIYSDVMDCRAMGTSLFTRVGGNMPQ
jgi:hypothetical protein